MPVLPLPQPQGPALETQTYDGLPGGMNVAVPPHLIGDDEAKYLQDTLIDYPGLLRKRGPVRPEVGFPTFAKKGVGIAGTITPAGTYRIAALLGDGASGEFRMLDGTFASTQLFSWYHNLAVSPYPIVDIKPTLLGGVCVGTSTGYTASSPSQALGFWRGGIHDNYTTGTVAFTVGSRTVTGTGTSWNTEASPGMFLFANTSDASRGNFTNTLIGTVKSVDSNTQITLVDPALYTSTGQSYTLQSVRGFQYRIVKGRITTQTSSTTVTGSNTKFVSQTMNSGTWNLYRASDFAWIGKVSSVTNEISATLAANSALALNNERFLAVKGDGDWAGSTMGSDTKPGFLTAFYAGRQWYANNGRDQERTQRVWFSDPADAEGVDFAEFDGDYLPVSSAVGTETPIKAIMPAYNALIVIKENETYAITGTTPTTFSIKKILDDGALSGMSVAAYGGGVIWAGLEGIYYYDGISVQNLSANKLGDVYKNAMRSVNALTSRMYAMVVRNHYMLHFENFAPNVAVLKGTFSVSPSSLTVNINMETRGIAFFTNVAIRGYVETPSDTGKNILYLVNDSTKANICTGYALFDEEVNDSILCDLGASATLYRYGEISPGSATAFAGVADNKYFSKVTVVAPAAIQSIQVYSGGQGGGSGTTNVRAGIYSDSAGAPNALLGSTSVVSLGQGDQPGYRSYGFATPIELAAGDYWIGVQVETSSRANFYQKATAAGIKTNGDTYSDGLANPFGAASNANGPLIAYAIVRSVGPDFYMESKRFSEGDSMWKKMFKQLSVEYIAQGGNLKLDTVTGLQNIGRTASSSYPPTVLTWDQLVALVGSWDALASLFPTWDSITEAQFKKKRIKFIKRNTLLSFRLWQESPAVTRVRIGPFQLAWKWMRRGRI